MEQSSFGTSEEVSIQLSSPFHYWPLLTLSSSLIPHPSLSSSLIPHPSLSSPLYPSSLPFFPSLSLVPPFLPLSIPPSIPLFSLLPPLLFLPPSLSPSLPSFLHLPHATVFIFVSPPPPLSSHTFLSTSPSHQSQCVCCTPQAVAVSSAPWTQTS